MSWTNPSQGQFVYRADGAVGPLDGNASIAGTAHADRATEAASTVAGSQDAVLYQVVHETHYDYEAGVTLSQQFLHMTPRDSLRQQLVSHQINVEPMPQEWREHVDYFGNPTRSFTLWAPHQKLLVRAISEVAVGQRKPLHAMRGSPAWEDVRDYFGTAQAINHEATQFLYDSPHVMRSADLLAYASPSFSQRRPLLDAVHALMQRIHRDFEFDSGATTIATPLSDVLTGRRGVCQDFAHLMIGCLRSLGLACRYVSGYILTTPPPGQPRMVGADASHAWVSVYCSVHGWIDFDPTNQCLVNTEHVTLGWGRDFSDVTPLRGIVLGGGEQELDVRVTVTPLIR